MKKQLIALGAIGVSVAPIAAVVSCGNDYGKNYSYYGDFQLITDSGSVSDKSFNESAFAAIKDYTNLIAQDKTFGFSQPKESNEEVLNKAYLSSLKKGVKTLLLPGFIHSDPSTGNAIHFAIEHKKDYENVKYISADGFANDNAFEYLLEPDKIPEHKTKYDLDNNKYQVIDNKGVVVESFDNINDARKKAVAPLKLKMNFGAGEYIANKFGNFYNLSYDSAESGFLASVYGGLYFNKIKNVTSPIKAATFGGIAIPFGVTSFMDGYLQGIKWFNDNNNQMQDIQPVFLGGSKASISDFTGSFEAGAGTSKSSSLINKGAQMILPVAGPQTGDTIGVIKKMNMSGKVFAFGVDTDQSKVYDPSLMLGSAIKGIYVSNSYALNVLNDNDPNNDYFGSFNQSLKVKPTGQNKVFENSFHNYVYGIASGPENVVSDSSGNNGLMGKLMASGMSKFDAEIRTLPTGFAPSSDKKDLTVLTNDQIYKNAQAFTESGAVQGMLNSAYPSWAKNTQNAIDTYNEWGSFWKVADNASKKGVS